MTGSTAAQTAPEQRPPNYCVLQELLHSMAMILFCRDKETAKTYIGYHPVDAMVGEMDWIENFHRVCYREGVLEERIVEERRANEQQVGGDHYRKVNHEYQHWDLMADSGMGYFEGQITKYAFRWKEKDGAKDVQKAIHYCSKMIELIIEGRYPMFPGRNPQAQQAFAKFCEVQGGVSDREKVVFEICLWRTTQKDLLILMEHLEHLLALAKEKERPATRPLAV